MPYNIDKIMLTTLCQKCSAPPTKTPLANFRLPNGLLWVPELLFCPQCGNYVTIHQRDMTEEELKETEERKKVLIQGAVDGIIWNRDQTGDRVSDSTTQES